MCIVSFMFACVSNVLTENSGSCFFCILHISLQNSSVTFLEVTILLPRSVKDDNFLNAEKDDSDGCGTPELPVLKTVNLANILKMPTYSADNEQNKENKKNDTPELPLLNSQDANLILSSRKTHQSPSKHQPQEDDLGDSPQLPELKTINLAAILREKGTLL